MNKLFAFLGGFGKGLMWSLFWCIVLIKACSMVVSHHG